MLSGGVGGPAAGDPRRDARPACRCRPRSASSTRRGSPTTCRTLYPDPFRFDPDRFLPEREAALPRGAYMPFGGGSRMCLGKRFGEYELRALAAVLLSRVRLEPHVGRRIPRS